MLLGVRAVIAESIERIHRSNLVGMGVLPLVYEAGENARSLGLDGTERFQITDLAAGLQPRQTVPVTARRPDGRTIQFRATARLDSAVEVEYFRNGGIMPAVLRKLLAPS
jgi:aconitate hydratase